MDLSAILSFCLFVCGIGLLVSGRNAGLEKRIAARIDVIVGHGPNSAFEVEKLGPHFDRFEWIPARNLRRDLRLISGTVPTILSAAFLAIAASAAGTAFWYGGASYSTGVCLLFLLLARRIVKAMAEHQYSQFLAGYPSLLDRIRKLVEAGNSLPSALEKALSYAQARDVRFIGPAVKRAELGVPLATALATQAQRLGILEISLLAFVAQVNTRFGGNLRDSVMHIAEVERGRARVNHELRALTAEINASAKVFSALPVIVASGIFLFHPAYVEYFVEDQIGIAILAFCVLSILIGMSAMRRLGRIE